VAISTPPGNEEGPSAGRADGAKSILPPNGPLMVATSPENAAASAATRPVSLAARHLKRQEFHRYLPHNRLKSRSNLVSLVRSSMV
jgi:hypothetical protein